MARTNFRQAPAERARCSIKILGAADREQAGRPQIAARFLVQLEREAEAALKAGAEARTSAVASSLTGACACADADANAGAAIVSRRVDAGASVGTGAEW